MTKEAVQKRIQLALLLPFFALLLTGCPKNEYVVELTPRDNGIERKLVFYRFDGVNSNGIPNYHNFPKDELGRIQSLYGRGSIKREGEVRTATGLFAGELPGDLGGAGSYTTLGNSLGHASFYVERLRGDDDLAGIMAARSEKIDRLVDYVIGWSRQQFGGERHYRDLRKFLDTDFRRDVRNAGFYVWLTGAFSKSRTDVGEEFGIRLGQYLVERGYLKVDDVPALMRAFSDDDWSPIANVLQRLVAAKLQIPHDAPLPDSVKALANQGKVEQSWTNFLATTDAYHERVRAWEKEKLKRDVAIASGKIMSLMMLHTNAPPPAAPPKPEPAEVAGDLVGDIADFHLFSPDADHAVVRLNLPAAPTHSNGKWDSSRKQVVWDSEIESGGELPAFCYANWCDPDEKFQTAHFGGVILKGDELLEYTLWRAACSELEANEWDSMLESLKSGSDLAATVDAFRFSSDPPKQNRAETAQKLLDEALKPTPTISR